MPCDIIIDIGLVPIRGKKTMSISVKNVNEKKGLHDGIRILVDEHIPEGKDEYILDVDLWPKELSPSERLCQTYDGNPGLWDEFVREYSAELDAERDFWINAIIVMARKSVVTLLYTCGTPDHNIAVVIKDYILRALTEQPEQKAA